jgi:hypothetical protein
MFGRGLRRSPGFQGGMGHEERGPDGARPRKHVERGSEGSEPTKARGAAGFEARVGTRLRRPARAQALRGNDAELKAGGAACEAAGRVKMWEACCAKNGRGGG